MTTILSEDFTTRPPTRDDAPAVATLIAACELADKGKAEMTTETLLADWQGLDLAEEAVVVTTAADDIAAYADLFNAGHVAVSIYGYVHPGYRGHGLGAYLVRWGEAWTQDNMRHAPEHTRVVVQHYIPATNGPARQLMEASAYTAVRTIYMMATTFDDPPPLAAWPENIRVRPFVPGQDERASFEVYEDASRDIWGRPPATFDRWLAFTQKSDPTLLFIAEDETRGEIAGVCACQLADGKGHVDGLRVGRAWRRQGLGLALLQHAFDEFYRRGARVATLSVDSESPTGAPRLYTRAGMTVAESYVLCRKELRPGQDFDQSAANS